MIAGPGRGPRHPLWMVGMTVLLSLLALILRWWWKRVTEDERQKKAAPAVPKRISAQALPPTQADSATLSSRTNKGDRSRHFSRDAHPEQPTVSMNKHASSEMVEERKKKEKDRSAQAVSFGAIASPPRAQQKTSSQRHLSSASSQDAVLAPDRDENEKASSQTSTATDDSEPEGPCLKRSTMFQALADRSSMNADGGKHYSGSSGARRSKHNGSGSGGYAAGSSGHGSSSSKQRALAAAASVDEARRLLAALTVSTASFEDCRRILGPTPKRPNPALPDFILLMGIPGSGKSTWTREFTSRMQLQKKHYVVISSDGIRRALTGSIDDQSANRLVWEVALAQCQGALRAHQNVILDATNVHTDSRRRFIRRLILGDVPEVSDALFGPSPDSPTNVAAPALVHTSGAPDLLGGGAQQQSLDNNAKKNEASEIEARSVTLSHASDMIRAASGGGSGDEWSAAHEEVNIKGPSASSGRLLRAAKTENGAEDTMDSNSAASVTKTKGQPPLVASPILFNRFIKVFNVYRTLAKTRIANDLQSGVVRAAVPTAVVDTMAMHFNDSLSATEGEDWMAVP